MSAMLDVVETWYRKVWTEEDAGAIDEMFVPDGKASGLGANILVGPDAFKQFHALLRNLLKDFNITIDKSIESGNWLSAICTFNARSVKTGLPVSVTGHIFVRINDGKINEAYNQWDFLGLYSQLGLLPADTFMRGLTGEKVA